MIFSGSRQACAPGEEGRSIKILVINPNTDKTMTEIIHEAAINFASGDFEVLCESAPGAPKFIAGYTDSALAAPGMFHLVEKYRNKVDAFIVACHGDPNLDALKELTDKPVIGIGEASMKIASMLGHKFSIISPVESIIPGKEELARKYYIGEQLASIRIPECREESFLKESILEAARRAVEEDMAEVIVLGCAAYAGMEKYLNEALKVPVVDGIICALIIARGLVRYGVSVSKIRKYKEIS